jgi:hypothetical protein
MYTVALFWMWIIAHFQLTLLVSFGTCEIFSIGFSGEDTLIPEQHAGEENRLFMLINKTKPKERDRKDNSTSKEHIT